MTAPAVSSNTTDFRALQVSPQDSVMLRVLTGGVGLADTLAALTGVTDPRIGQVDFPGVLGMFKPTLFNVRPQIRIKPDEPIATRRNTLSHEFFHGGARQRLPVPLESFRSALTSGKGAPLDRNVVAKMKNRDLEEKFAEAFGNATIFLSAMANPEEFRAAKARNLTMSLSINEKIRPGSLFAMKRLLNHRVFTNHPFREELQRDIKLVEDFFKAGTVGR